MALQRRELSPAEGFLPVLGNFDAVEVKLGKIQLCACVPTGRCQSETADRLNLVFCNSLSLVVTYPQVELCDHVSLLGRQTVTVEGLGFVAREANSAIITSDFLSSTRHG